jgi:hypothetical protein
MADDRFLIRGVAERVRRQAMEPIEAAVLDKVLAGDELDDGDRRILEGLRDRLATPDPA